MKVKEDFMQRTIKFWWPVAIVAAIVWLYVVIFAV